MQQSGIAIDVEARTSSGSFGLLQMPPSATSGVNCSTSTKHSRTNDFDPQSGVLGLQHVSMHLCKTQVSPTFSAAVPPPEHLDVPTACQPQKHPGGSPRPSQPGTRAIA